MKSFISTLAFISILLLQTSCTTTSGTDELFDEDINTLEIGTSKSRIKSILGSPSEVFENVGQSRTQEIIQRHIENESLDIPEGFYDVWFYKAQKRTHHYYVFFFYNTYEKNHCYFIFDNKDIAIYKRCQSIE